MAYKVSTNAEGRTRWWQEDESLPPGETNVRQATPEEAEIMGEIMKQDAAYYMPSDVLGDKIRAMLSP